ncbi:MAG: 23S rRNA (guanosine(2251)-2'-O)-methyltransferase RlmB [Chloroflexi bacterium]|nr:23S rRNA (guanosine(2251)-2'-O)-methyltransferase RlmB [Chloroflexota bacterium]
MDIIWGRNPVHESLRAGRAIKRILLAKGTKPSGVVEILQQAKARAIRVEYVDRQRLDHLAGTPKHQGIVAEVPPFQYSNLADILSLAQSRGEYPLILILDSLQDPQNLGTLIRTAEAAGAHGVVIPEHRAVGVTPTVVKASAGAIEHLLVAQVTNLARAIEELKEAGVWVVGIDMDGRQAFDEIDWNLPAALVVGAEGKGLGRLVKEKCDLVVRIPMRGQVSSLNAAVAGSIVLYHAWRKRTGRT